MERLESADVKIHDREQDSISHGDQSGEIFPGEEAHY